MDDSLLPKGKIMNKYTYLRDMWTPVPMLENCDYRYSRIFNPNNDQNQQKQKNPDQETSK